MRFLRTTKLTAALAGALLLVAAGISIGFFFADRLRHDLAATSATAAPDKTDPSAPTVTNPGTGDPLEKGIGEEET